MSKKVFTVDTSPIIHDPRSLRNFQDNVVVIPYWVIQELDGLKEAENGRGFAAREAIRFLRSLVGQYGSLEKGVPLEGGGELFVSRDMANIRKKIKGLPDTIDNRIVATALFWHIAEERRPARERRPVILVTKDGTMAITADTCGLKVQDYLTDRGILSASDLPTGHIEIPFTGDRGTLSKFFKEGKIPESFIHPIIGDDVPTNTCISLTFEDGRGIHGIWKGDYFSVVSHKAKSAGGQLNLRQAFAEALICSPEISIVALAGQAGTGKTFSALVAGLKHLQSQFQHITVYRPNIPLGKDLGYLPGNLDEKFAPWMRPIVDNLESIFEIFRAESWCRQLQDKDPYQLIRDSVVEVSPINFIRGRSIAHSLVIVDECQNLTPHEVKTIISRAAAGTKIVLTGDLGQIDNPFLDPLTNGLAHVIKKLHGMEDFGHVLLTEGERSKLADLAARYL
ncbi:MAG: PhoH family protein [Patescibacteria group bacterium]